jgi:heme exporter protein C
MRVLKALLLPYMAVVIVAAFLWPKPAKGFLGESSRIVFFHVPCAWTATIAFLFAAGYSIAYLVRRDFRFDDLAAASVRLGLLFAVVTLITGSLFARIMWGSYWNWDPRESSFLLLVFLYSAYLFLRGSVDDPQRRAQLSAAYALFAVILMPFLTFVAPRITQSLHPQTVINPERKNLMDPRHTVMLFASWLGLLSLFFWLLSLDGRLSRLERTKRAQR